MEILIKKRGISAEPPRFLVRAMGLEPTTSTLARGLLCADFCATQPKVCKKCAKIVESDNLSTCFYTKREYNMHRSLGRVLWTFHNYVAKQKGRKMIERILTHVQGKLGEWNIDEIKNHIIDMIECNYEKTLDPKVDGNAVDMSKYAAYLMFGSEHYVHINSKNIEFSESFHYENFRPQSDRMIKLFARGYVKDFLIQLWVYRLGQYSYFAATCTALFECDDFMASETIC